jgi:hypothetical protein
VDEPGHEPATPFEEDGDDIRVIRVAGSGAAKLMPMMLAGVAILAGIAWFASMPASPPPATGQPAAAESAPVSEVASPAPVAASTPRTPPRTAPMQPMETSASPDDLPSGDPNDIATYVSPTDPEPTAAEVIQALHDIGDHTGIGAFNPPGTSPPLRGLAVPEDFVLPPGYVRHHQVTDEGEPLEPILMFSPDVSFVDASGRNVPIPESRVVPPEMAPPGLPIRIIAIPPKP